MKVVIASDGNNGSGKKVNPPPPLPLKDELPPEEDEQRIAKFKLRTNPTRADSPTYSFSIRKLNGEEHLRYALRFITDVRKILSGLNITNALQALTLVRELLSGVALSEFNRGIADIVHHEHMELQAAERERGIASGDDDATIAAAVASIAPPGPHMPLKRGTWDQPLNTTDATLSGPPKQDKSG